MISTPISPTLPQGLYRGFVPFALANAFGAIVLHNLAGKDRQEFYGRAFEEDINVYNQELHYPVGKIL